jgi:hypothetical protein
VLTSLGVRERMIGSCEDNKFCEPLSTKLHGIFVFWLIEGHNFDKWLGDHLSKVFNFDEFKSWGLHENCSIVMWNLETISEFAWSQGKPPYRDAQSLDTSSQLFSIKRILKRTEVSRKMCCSLTVIKSLMHLLEQYTTYICWISFK